MDLYELDTDRETAELEWTGSYLIENFVHHLIANMTELLCRSRRCNGSCYPLMEGA